MEIRELAIRILSADTLEGKLFFPKDTVTDLNPGPPLFWKTPTRPSVLKFSSYTRKKDKLPPFHALEKIENRVTCLHRFFGHELLAVEIMAYALLAFPEASKRFRKGLLNTLKDEQGHVRLYIERLKALGASPGDFPLHEHFWAFTKFMKTPSEYVSTLCMTFEMANLDFATMYGQWFSRFDDQDSAALMGTILKDEIAHVGFGYNWLKKWKLKEESDWEAWLKALPNILNPKRAKGFVFHEEPRRKAGLSGDWIQKFKDLSCIR